MLGWDATFYRDGKVVRDNDGFMTVKGGEELLYLPPTTKDIMTPISEVAIEAPSTCGYPSIYRVYARDLPYGLNVPNEEIITVKLWDQS